MGLHLFYVTALVVSILVYRSSAIGFRRLSRAEFENLKETCGKPLISNYPRGSVQRVARGSVAKQGEFPWAVLFFSVSTVHVIYDGIPTSMVARFRCSGSIISKYHVITAAHCVIPDEVYRGSTPFDIENAYIIGGSPCANTTVNFQGQPISVSQSAQACTGQPHENLRTLKIKNIIVPRSTKKESPSIGEAVPDIAILELEDPISDMDNELLPVCVSAINTISPQTLTAYGFGFTEIGENVELHKLRVPGYQWVPANKCSMWNNEKRCRDSVEFQLANEYGSICEGDSGGAVTGLVEGTEYLFGVMSRSSVKNCNSTLGAAPLKRLPDENTFTVTLVAYYSDFLCFYTGICPLGYDVYSEWNYAMNSESAFIFPKTGYKKGFNEGNYALPVRKVKAGQGSPDESYREKERFERYD